jgi:hypothetical protein
MLANFHCKIQINQYYYYPHPTITMLSIFRQYTFDDSFQQVFISSKFLKEYQIALTFATDYDLNNIPSNGIFRPTWDTTKITPESITNFKKQHPEVNIKVYISIGNRGTKFPFSPQSTNKSWILNATKSLTNIIKSNKEDSNLQVDGIDVLRKINLAFLRSGDGVFVNRWRFSMEESFKSQVRGECGTGPISNSK